VLVSLAIGAVVTVGPRRAWVLAHVSREDISDCETVCEAVRSGSLLSDELAAVASVVPLERVVLLQEGVLERGARRGDHRGDNVFFSYSRVGGEGEITRDPKTGEWAPSWDGVGPLALSKVDHGSWTWGKGRLVAWGRLPGGSEGRLYFSGNTNENRVILGGLREGLLAPLVDPASDGSPDFWPLRLRPAREGEPFVDYVLEAPHKDGETYYVRVVLTAR
jgi:hypothetical protein